MAPLITLALEQTDVVILMGFIVVVVMLFLACSSPRKIEPAECVFTVHLTTEDDTCFYLTLKNVGPKTAVVRHMYVRMRGKFIDIMDGGHHGCAMLAPFKKYCAKRRCMPTDSQGVVRDDAYLATGLAGSVCNYIIESGEEISLMHVNKHYIEKIPFATLAGFARACTLVVEAHPAELLSNGTYVDVFTLPLDGSTVKPGWFKRVPYHLWR